VLVDALETNRLSFENLSKVVTEKMAMETELRISKATSSSVSRHSIPFRQQVKRIERLEQALESSEERRNIYLSHLEGERRRTMDRDGAMSDLREKWGSMERTSVTEPERTLG